MDFPESVLDVVEASVKEHPSDIEQAVLEAEQQIRQLPEFGEVSGLLVSLAVRELVYRNRCAVNDRLKDQARYQNIRPKVNGLSESVNRAYQSVYDGYYIGRTVLGDIAGEDIDNLAEAEESRSNGHHFNALLLRWLKDQGVTGDKRVREVVKEKKLWAQFKKLYREVHGVEPSPPVPVAV